tara:strand:+ start:771 stop:905 length:135 start_codon:yes stop_codon:yes gene_type:complete
MVRIHLFGERVGLECASTIERFEKTLQIEMGIGKKMKTRVKRRI